MERDEWCCMDCGSTTATLNVHHGYYERGKKPWEYPIESLRTVCEVCHVRRERNQRLVLAAVAQLGPKDLESVTGYACGLVQVREVVDVEVSSEDFAEGLRAVFGRPLPVKPGEILVAGWEWPT